MLNYIKSECYRIIHGKEFYFFTFILAGLTLAMNLVLYLFNSSVSDFPYGIVRYSLNMLTDSMGALFICGSLLVTFLFSDEYKNGTLKNTVSYGVPRSVVFIGKCVVSTMFALISMLVILLVYISSAFILLPGQVALPLQQMQRGILVNMPMAVASIILAVGLLCIAKKDTLAALVWAAIMIGIPTVCFYLGLKLEIANKIAEWMPWNYLKYQVTADMGTYDCLWNTGEGVAKCMISGGIGILVFLIIGIVGFRKKEIA